MSNWDSQGKGVRVSGNFLDHYGKGRNITNAEFYGVDPSTERTDFLLNNGDGTHRHIEVDAYGNKRNWGDHPNRNGNDW